jgi:hypothetical protein
MIAAFSFTHGDWEAIQMGLVITVFVGIVLLCAVYPIILFMRQVWRSTR